MTKYVIYTESFEFDPRKHQTAEEAWEHMDDHFDKVIALCDDLEQARAILAEQRTSVHHYSHKLAGAEIAYLAEEEWEQDEDGEWEFINGSDIWEVKA